MKVIENKDKIISKTLGKQKIKENTIYRPLRYVRIISVEDGKLLFNLLTGEILLLSDEEIKFFSKTYDNNLMTKLLIEKWFLVPEDIIDSDLSKQVTNFFQMLSSIYTAPKINSFTILPTTDCNARCFYCYEHGCQKKWMDEKTALDVVDYIMSKKTDGEIKLRWFGGEPLYNSKVIDLICGELKKRNVKFYSNMVSNGYLFDDEMIVRAKSIWNLKRIQITIDGTEETYNRVKAYIYKDENSPFKRVMSNLVRLLKADVNVVIRMNMDIHNIDDLFNLTTYLLDEFSSYQKFDLYPHLLYDCGQKPVGERDEKYLNDKYIELRNIIAEKIKRKLNYDGTLKLFKRCMAETDSSIMILPDGKLGKCEHFIDDHYIGSIYDEKIDVKTVSWYKQVKVTGPECDTCDLRPSCVHLQCCPSVPKTCDNIRKINQEYNLDRCAILYYEHEKEKNNEA